MNEDLANRLMASLSADARAFLPELILCGAIVFMLLIRLVPRYDRLHLGWIALFLSLGAFLISLMQWPGIYWPEPIGEFAKILDPRRDFPITDPRMSLFGGMLVFDNFTIFIRLFLYSFVTLVIGLTLMTGIPDGDDSADFYCLLFGSTIGMAIMASSDHLLMVFLGVEMASVPSYALAGFLKGRRSSSEAALKYVVYGGGAAGVMLYGISLLAGHPDIGSGYLPNIIHAMSTRGLMSSPIIILALTFILAGIGFKLASVPFHFWCPDVFEGAAAEVGAFLSVASKGAALALLARVGLGLAALTGAAPVDELGLRISYEAWSRAVDFLVPVLALAAIVTTTFGNLAAYGQTNLKRLLAYSTIAHAGFMMMGLSALTREGTGAVLFYLVVYLFMNLGAFAVVAFMRNITGQEDLSYYRGFVYRSPVLVITLGIFLLSLLGLPPLAGFAAKFQILSILFDAAQLYAREGKPMLTGTMYALVFAGAFNTVLSLFYYVKVLKVMVLEKTLEEVEDRPIEARPTPIAHAVFATILAGVILGLGIFWNPLAEATSVDSAVSGFRAAPARPRTEEAPPAAAKKKQGGA